MVKHSRFLSFFTVCAMALGIVTLFSETSVAAPVEAYSLWVGDTRVTADNKDDIPSVTGEGAKASFNPATNTLTLENVTGVTGTSLGALISAEGIDLTIRGDAVLEGKTNALRADMGIQVAPGSLTLDGDFTITAMSYGLYVQKNISVIGGDVSIGGAYAYGVYSARGAVNVTGGTLASEGSLAAIQATDGVTYGDSHYVKIPEGGTAEGYSIVDAEGMVSQKALITPKPVYTIVWLNGDGSELDRATHMEGAPVPTTDKTPTKAADAEYTYTFDTWDVGTVDGLTTTYKPVFTATAKPVDPSTPTPTPTTSPTVTPIESPSATPSGDPTTPSDKPSTPTPTSDPKPTGTPSADPTIPAPADTCAAADPAKQEKVYRLYNPGNSEHLFTTDAVEYEVLADKHGWKQEGVAWVGPNSRGSSVGVYRLYNAGLGDHHYTKDQKEAQKLVSEFGWVYDNNGQPLFYSEDNDKCTRINVYRQYNGGLKTGQHHYTADKTEWDTLAAKHGWQKEGIGWYAISWK